MKLTHLTDQALLQQTKALAGQYREVTTKLLHHLKEIETRKLFSELGYPSLFEYVVRELGFSEASAARRINVARLLADIPELEPKIQTGELNITNLSMVFKAFRDEEIQNPEIKREIIKKIENTSSRECEKTLRQFKDPSQEVPMRHLKISITLETIEVLNKLKGVLAHRNLSEEKLYYTIFTSALKALTQEKYKLTAKRITSSKNPRYVTATLKKEIYEEAKGRCTNCGSTYALEIDHIEPYALGGKTIKENLRLLCRSCNQRHKIRHFGQGNASAHRGKR